MISIMRRGFNFLKRHIHSYVEDTKYTILYPYAMYKYKNNEIYLISERGTDARDNGYHLFKYIREHYPKVEVYYVIREDSSDYEKVKRLGNVVRYGSFQHYLLFIAAKYKISTHIMGYAPDMLHYIGVNQKHRIPGKQIFLQHGVTKNDMIGLYQEYTRLDLFICGAQAEYEYVRNTFHYQRDEVRYTGLARYDNLHHYTVKNQILVMPTWRVYLKNISNTERKKSDYFVLWNRLLHDERIISMLRKQHMEMVFYLHYEMQPYIDWFSSGAEEIRVADFAHYDVQTLLKESKLMVTDYSSVFFDFAYMRKPCVYFQFDQERFFSSHYKKGYFDYNKMGFGEIVVEYDDLIKLLLEYIENGCEMKPEYRGRAIKFFPLYDTNNCDRIWKEIKNLK